MLQFISRERTPLWLVLSLGAAGTSHAQSTAPVKELGVVVIQAVPPSTLPSHIPTTMESIHGSEVEDRINASDSEDALKYFPSLLVRKRYPGDYNHAMLSSRASGTGNPARSAVYADGILLSNFLGNSVSGLGFPPRWGMVTPEEIERVDVMYGPFSAAYPGNSVGAVVDYVTRMPSAFETHASMGYTSQPFDLYNTHATYRTWQTSASVGNRQGDWSWLLNFNHLDSAGQPLTFATRAVSAGATPTTGVAVNGAVPDRGTSNADQYVIGAGTQYSTRQDHVKAKVAYDISSAWRLTYTLGLWQNSSEGRSQSYLADAVSGQAIGSGPVVIQGKQFAAMTGADLPLSNENLLHAMQGLSIKSHTRDVFDWELSASHYDYNKDQKRQNGSSATWPGALSTGPGTLADGAGTGWRQLAMRGTWRPNGLRGSHVVDFGYQQDAYWLHYLTSSVAGNWTSDPAGPLSSLVGGTTRLHSVHAQDTWRMNSQWMAVWGLRSENWQASGGQTEIAASAYAQLWNARQEHYLSPKMAIAYQWHDDTVLKVSIGRAVRMPTVFELYGATSTNNSRYINDPNVRPERSWTTELSLEKEFEKSLWRMTYFNESTRDGLYAQGIFDAQANTTVSRVQNIGKIAIQGWETALNSSDVGIRGLDLTGSITYADSVIKENAGYVTTPGDTLGKMQPNIPHWRATGVATYRMGPDWSGTLAARYSGQQYRTLNNADVNGETYMGVSRFLTLDTRLRYKMDKQWSMAVGVDNLNNDRQWNFHPYPQRSYHAELKYNLR